MKKQLGIENLQAASLAICKVSMKLDKALEDGKITKWELLGVGFSSIKNLPFVFQKAPDIELELRDLDSSEWNTLKTYVKNHLDLREDKVEVLVLKGLELLKAITEFANELRK